MIWSGPLRIVEGKSCREIQLEESDSSKTFAHGFIPSYAEDLSACKFYRSLLCQEEDDVEREDLEDDIADVESDYVAEDNAYVESEDGEEDDVESGISFVKSLVYVVVESQCYSVVAATSVIISKFQQIGKDKGFKQVYEVTKSLKEKFDDKEKRLTRINKFVDKHTAEDDIEVFSTENHGLDWISTHNFLTRLQKLSSYASGHLEVSELAACLEKASFSCTSGHVEVF
ncbi:hypothetical protein Tco_0972376 [Tanacetum coccineum]